MIRDCSMMVCVRRTTREQVLLPTRQGKRFLPISLMSKKVVYMILGATLSDEPYRLMNHTGIEKTLLGCVSNPRPSVY
jgi:hypothetical protein